MRKTVMIITVLSALAALLLASGCGGQSTVNGSSAELTVEKYNQIQVGISSSQLTALAGEPSKRETKSMSGGHSMGGGSMTGGSMSMEYWYYQGSKGWVRLEVAEDKVTAKSGY